MRSFRKAVLVPLMASVVCLPSVATAQDDGAGQADAPRCVVNFEAPTSYTGLIKDNGFQIENYADFCAWMNENGLLFDIYGEYGTMQDRAYAWVLVKFMRSENRVASPDSERISILSDVATDTEAKAIWLKALDSAMRYLAEDKETHLKAVETEEARQKSYWQSVK